MLLRLDPRSCHIQPSADRGDFRQRCGQLEAAVGLGNDIVGTANQYRHGIGPRGRFDNHRRDAVAEHRIGEGELFAQQEGRLGVDPDPIVDTVPECHERHDRPGDAELQSYLRLCGTGEPEVGIRGVPNKRSQYCQPLDRVVGEVVHVHHVVVLRRGKEESQRRRLGGPAPAAAQPHGGDGSELHVQPGLQHGVPGAREPARSVM